MTSRCSCVTVCQLSRLWQDCGHAKLLLSDVCTPRSSRSRRRSTVPEDLSAQACSNTAQVREASQYSAGQGRTPALQAVPSKISGATSVPCAPTSAREVASARWTRSIVTLERIFPRRRRKHVLGLTPRNNSYAIKCRTDTLVVVSLHLHSLAVVRSTTCEGDRAGHGQHRFSA